MSAKAIPSRHGELAEVVLRKNNKAQGVLARGSRFGSDNFSGDAAQRMALLNEALQERFTHGI
jgi:hypothetical protein